jgi:hypothetical protein
MLAIANEALLSPNDNVNMLCIDYEGNPVSGAEVHLFQRTGGKDARYVHFGPFQSDEHGKAVCAEAVFSNENGNFDRWIYARIPGRLVGVARCAKWTNQRVINSEGRVELQPSRPVEGKLNVPQGYDPTKVTVRVQALHVLTAGADLSTSYNSFPRDDGFPGLDTALPEIFDCRPDAAGGICFNDVPVRGRLYLVTVGSGLAEAQWMNENYSTFDRPIELTVDAERAILGRILAPDGRPAVGMRVAARRTSRPGQRVFYLSTFRAVSDENGHFVIRGLPQSEFVLSVEDPKNSWTLRPLERIQPDPPNLTLTMESGVVVTGRVFDSEGNPVEAAHFSAITDSDLGSGLSHATTDSEGRYQFRLPAGGANLYFDGLPDGFAYPDPQIVKHLQIKSGQRDIENLDFSIQRK